MSKRVLIITYYWPPSAGSGVQRWLKFAKYLPEFGWEPVIFTPENPDFELKDESLMKEISPSLEILKFPIWEPYGVFRKLKKETLTDTAKVLEKTKKSFTDKVGIWLRANALIPDPRKFWVKPSVDFLTDLIEKGQFEAIITTGPPHSLHLIGSKLKRQSQITWLADFRDPWSKWEFLDTLPMMDWVRKKHKALERDVLTNADGIITISPTFQKDFEVLSGRKIHLLTNGFDSADLPGNWTSLKPSGEGIEILYTGVIDAIRNPIPFLNALKEEFENNSKKVTLRFVGKVSEKIKNLIESDPWFQNHVKLEGYVPHEAVFSYYQKAHLLLLILTDTKNAKGNIPGKIFEYMATGRPIVALGDPLGDSAQILKDSDSGQVFTHTDLLGIKSFLHDFKPKPESNKSGSIEKYSRKNLTGQLAKILDETTGSFS
ncbi:glycosyltransferase family 4 protein [Aquiflexum sp. LQ15W]|uniref:glycosyltransferase family 4 protein n=1 Tax=Cognataquiflexum nitidum TaxID=2922272 RepID=UPI001F140D18|nr:glycosyltransferase family 4 protein [Cognataquiflexum nitidum]MCH6201644.1 glycosyltransferase family 4 protein [Cognataquiflexum nitidum]